MRPSRNPLLVEAFGVVLKERRNELSLTQEDLAGAAEIDRPYITMIEAARKQPTLSVLWRIASGLQLSAAELMKRVDEKYLKLEAVALRASKKPRKANDQ